MAVDHRHHVRPRAIDARVNFCFERLARSAVNLLRIEIDRDDVVGGEDVARDVARADDALDRSRARAR